MIPLISTVLIVNDVETMVNELVLKLPTHDTRIIKNEEDGKNDFLITHSKQAIKEAYIAVDRTKYILLCGDTFKVEAQNSLLKVLEEPPLNIIFILITTSKNTILPTILSRMPHKFLKTKTTLKECELNFNNLDLNTIYSFLKTNQRITKNDAKELIESMLYKIHKDNKKLNITELDAFNNAVKLCNLNSKPINILTMLLLNLSVKK